LCYPTILIAIAQSASAQHSYSGIDKSQHAELIKDFMASVQVRDGRKAPDFSTVHVQHVINFDKTTNVNVAISAQLTKPSLSKKIEYPGMY
jgi:hypothetical protein